METTSQDKLNSLREILLTQDREDAQGLSARLDELEDLLYSQEKLSKHVSPIVAHKIEKFEKAMPDELGSVITETLQKQIEVSKEQVAEALYPVMGKMIKRYIQNEIKILSERINKQLSNTFSYRRFKQRLISLFTGVKESDIILSDLGETTILQVFVIEKDSGILLGSYTKENAIDKDLISGMLTAIKSFVEDAFMQEKQNLEGIEYELYNIHLQNFHTYYIASVISGILTESKKDTLENNIITAANKINKLKNKNKINNTLTSYFNDGDN